MANFRHHRHHNTIGRMFLFVVTATIFLGICGVTIVTAEQDELCACSPSAYVLTFDFSLECEPINVDFENGGIADAVCLVTGFDNINVTDLVPVAISSIQFIEIGQDGGPVNVDQISRDFGDGNSFEFTSISATPGVQAPRAFQVRALGRNAAAEPLVLQWAITYTNNCGVFPVLEEGNNVGWTMFVSFCLVLGTAYPSERSDYYQHLGIEHG